ncbi:4-(cytidine 5'-diphospho)-2-C-methyl-D-erythritol kinase [Undibacter mobilis]|uniref:4-diphosphocytidyl-2-C-methyl-D-erythritol kinase n=1 Tax=Undibacter mobilis TaxID=2292256 RepID=A0A371B442_9BRAD|nr:4-(cytidine 5'-diphospho)-2-C-methyl-D-erythritol kinase [Undibacter mobilis]RDV02320.1 4-(cytidine 5'-diphospho)-2-C-methyl-D-erythritol kinase [Undibacter mobilis]
MSHLTETARAKINLTLRITGRRADGYHELESLVAFAGIADTLTLEPAGHTSLDIAGPFADVIGAAGDNLILKAFRALAALVPGLKGGRFHLDKHIPVAGGVGGGSADAAAALRLLARHNGMSFDDARLMTAALQTGADVPVCFVSRACVMTGVGERLSPPLRLPQLPALLVNPRVGVATRDVFAALARAGLPKDRRTLGDIPHEAGALIDYLRGHGNDLTASAIACAPVIGEVLDALAALPGVTLARMSGSGGTCFALFATESEATTAESSLAVRRPDWWAAATVLNRTP